MSDALDLDDAAVRYMLLDETVRLPEVVASSRTFDEGERNTDPRQGGKISGAIELRKLFHVCWKDRPSELCERLDERSLLFVRLHDGVNAEERRLGDSPCVHGGDETLVVVVGMTGRVTGSAGS